MLFYHGPGYHLFTASNLRLLDTKQGNVIFALPFVPGHQPLHVTDILGLIFVMTGLVVYRFGPALYHVFDRIEAGGERVAKAATSIRGRSSGINDAAGSAFALGEHRKPLLDLAEEGGDDEDKGLLDGRRLPGGGGVRGKKKAPAVADDEWEM